MLTLTDFTGQKFQLVNQIEIKFKRNMLRGI